MKPMTAVTLIIAKANSASPYPLTPQRLIIIIVKRKMLTNMALLSCGFQYMMVIEAAIISNGRTTNHCSA